MRKLTLGVLCAGLTLVSGFGKTDGVGLPVTVAQADAAADDCVGIRKAEIERGLEFSVESSCEQKLACTIGWTLSCESTKGAVTHRSKSQKSFALAAGAVETVTSSAETCKQGWRIDGVQWRCDPVK